MSKMNFVFLVLLGVSVTQVSFAKCLSDADCVSPKVCDTSSATCVAASSCTSYDCLTRKEWVVPDAGKCSGHVDGYINDTHFTSATDVSTGESSVNCTSTKGGVGNVITSTTCSCTGSSSPPPSPPSSTGTTYCDSAQVAKGCNEGSSCCLCPVASTGSPPPPVPPAPVPPAPPATTTSTGAPPSPPAWTAPPALSSGSSSTFGAPVTSITGGYKSGCVVPPGAIEQKKQKNSQCPGGYTSINDYCGRGGGKLCVPSSGVDDTWGKGRPMLGP